ncbi:MAG TPA: hypothetical protein VKA46_36260 [Gemmataceae bacterium]|nr:hypothetical protein [Gemmataceae bacterium]
MRGILADINIQGQVEIIRLIVEGDYWRDVWTGLALSVYTFADVGLVGKTPDDVIWRLCQQRELVLVTANRNKDGPDSLEATIQNENTPRSLPVLTLADSEGVRHSRSYAE